MFTGLIQTVGQIEDRRATPAGVRLVVRARPSEVWNPAVALGDSIAVSGVCLTVAELPAEAGGRPGGRLAFDVIPETLSRTNLGRAEVGDAVNLEASVTASTLMGGHFVQGHVDGLATVESVKTDGEWRVALRPPAELMPCMTPKGSVSLDGVSLTLAHVDPAAGRIEVALIPVTLERTTLAAWKPGRAVNVEADVVAKTVVNFMRHYAGR